MKERDYQIEAVDSIWNYFIKGGTGNPLVASPTGTGKSVIIGSFIKSVYKNYPNQRIMMLTHVKELIEQNYDKLMKMWPTAPAGIYSAGLNRRDLYNNITFAGIGSVANRAIQFGHIDLIIIDEAHLVSPTDNTMYRRFITALKEYNPHLKIIGFTATPYRLGQGLLTEEGGLFTDVCFDITTMLRFNKLIEDGYLSPLVPKRTHLILNVDGVPIRGGEFSPKDLQVAVNKDDITEAAVKETIEMGHDRKAWLVFTAGVDHAIQTRNILEYYGVSARVVHSGNKEHKMTNVERDTNIREFKEGKFQALVNNQVLTTGFDHPQIDMIVMLKPTSSPGLWVQMLGRGTRPVYADGFNLETAEGRHAAMEMGGKRNCLVLDFGGNTKRLGPINDPVVPRRKGKKGGEPPSKLCEAITKDNKVCDTWLHASLRFCTECGHEFTFKTKLKQDAGTDELIKGDLPVVEEFKIDHITYAYHMGRDKPPMMLVNYYCNLKNFKDPVCFEHTNYAQTRAKKWWKERTELPFPESTEAGVNLATKLKTPTSIRVWTNKKYPQIMSYCYDGSHFGKKEPDPLTLPTVASDKINVPQTIAPDFDDDIPF